MSWVMKLSVVTLIVGATLTVSFLFRRQWVLRWRGYTAVVRSSLLRVVMRVDGDVVAASWRRPGAEVDLQALVEDAHLGLLAFRAVAGPGLRPRCQIYVNGDWMGGDLLPGTRYDPVSWRLEEGDDLRDPLWAEARDLLLALRERGGDSPRVVAATDGLGALARARVQELVTLKRASMDGPTRARGRVLEDEVESLLAAARALHRAHDGQGVIAEALDRAERLIAHLSPARQAPRTFQLKPAGQADHSGSARVARKQALGRREEG